MTTARALEILGECLCNGGVPVTVTAREVDAAIVQVVCTRACRVCGSRAGQYCDAKRGLHLGRLRLEEARG